MSPTVCCRMSNCLQTMNVDIHFDSHTGPAIGNDRSIIAQAAYIKATACNRGRCGGLWSVDIQIPEIIAHTCKVRFSFVFELY